MIGEIIGGAIGGLFGGSKSESSSSNNSYVWDQQSPYLEDLFKYSKDLYNDGWQADGVADFNSTQDQAMANLLNYANTTGSNIANTNLNTANQLLGGYGSAQNYYADLMNGGANFNANANQFINSDLVNSQINAANQAVTDQFDQTMNGIAANSASGMNTGSTRRSAAEVMAAKEAAKLKANNVSTIQNNAYQNALGQMNLGASNMMNMANTGTNMLNNSYSMGIQPFQTALNVGGLQQDMTQSQFDWLNNNQWDLLGRYQAAIGTPTILGSSTSSGSTANYTNGLGKLIGNVAGQFVDTSLGGASAGYGMGATGYGMGYGINPLGQQANMLANQW